jgi:hypothetical protein
MAAEGRRTEGRGGGGLLRKIVPQSTATNVSPNVSAVADVPRASQACGGSSEHSTRLSIEHVVLASQPRHASNERRHVARPCLSSKSTVCIPRLAARKRCVTATVLLSDGRRWSQILGGETSSQYRNSLSNT